MAGGSGWSWLVWSGLIGTPLLIGAGQVMFKVVSGRLAAVDLPALRGLLVDPYFIVAMAIYASATVSWILVLRAVPLGAAYSFTALGFLFVPILSAVLFGEALTLRYFMGALMIMGGLVVIHA